MIFESIREREYLLEQGRGLVTPLGFLYARLQGDHMPGWIFGLGLCAYDLMAGKWQHRSYDALDMRELCPPLSSPALRGGYRFFDAQTDDARLVLRLLRDSVESGGTALNYTRAVDLLRTREGRVSGVLLQDTSGNSPQTAEVKAKVVINATGVWVDEVRQKIDRPSRMRPLRGSHLIISHSRLPITRSVTFLHPQDGRPVFALPWEGVTLFGTTDLDHDEGLITDPASPWQIKFYIPYPCSHFLGMDVHDVGNKGGSFTQFMEQTPQESIESRILEPGMVLTIEPGLYFREKGQ